MSKKGLNNTIIISGGGTGGHIYPAIAIANAYKERFPSSKIVFVGAKGKMEMQKVPEAGYPIIGLWISGLQRSLSISNLLFPVKLLVSLFKSALILKKHRPAAVVGVGGFASGAILWVAQIFGIPTLIQEQNSYAGITNKRLSKKAKRICVAYNGMDKMFPASKIVFTGNPVRKDILNISEKRNEGIKEFGLDGNKKIILAIGGSLGALSINESIKNRIADFEKQNIQILWQTGKFFYPQAKELNSENIKVLEFIKRMDLAYAVADIVISRAGALSISELCLVAKPAILVPFPFAAEDHQTHNAMSLVNADAAILVKDNEARTTLIDKAFELLRDNEKQQVLASNIKKLAKPNASDEIVDELIKLMN